MRSESRNWQWYCQQRYCRQSCRQISLLISLLIVPVIMALFILLQCTAANAADSLKVATVGAIQGTAKRSVDSGKTWKPIEILTELSAGDQLTLENKSSVKVIFYNPPHRETLTGPCKVQISSNNCSLIQGSPGLVKTSTAYKGVRALKSIKSSSQNFAGVEIRNEPDVVNLLSPRGKVASLNPRFEWKPVVKAQEYLLTLEDLDGKTIWNQTTSDVQAQYPDSSPPLKPGKSYFWNVRAAKDKKIIARGSASFKLISGEVYENLKLLKEQTGSEVKENPNDPEPYVVLLTFYMENQLLDEAIDTCEQLLKMKPGDGNVRELMSRLNELKGMKMK